MKFPIISAKFYLSDGKVVSTSRTHKTSRLYYRIRHGKFLKVYFKVEYGIKETNHGKEMFFNDATCTDKDEALKTLGAFLE